MKKSAVTVIQLMRDQALRVFLTSDLVTLIGMSRSATVQVLRRLATRKIVARIKRGVWANLLATDLHPYEIAPYLRAPWITYVSLYSVLSDHGLVAEIPQVTYGISAALPKKYRTVLGEFRIHHLSEHLIWGYESRRIGRGSFLMADLEKAFLDLVYLALTPRSPLRLPWSRDGRWRLDRAKLKKYARRFAYPALTDWLRRNRLSS